MKQLNYISIGSARIEMTRLVDTVRDLGERFVVYKHNSPTAVMISLEDYKKLERWERHFHMASFEPVIDGKVPVPRGGAVVPPERRRRGGARVASTS